MGKALLKQSSANSKPPSCKQSKPLLVNSQLPSVDDSTSSTTSSTNSNPSLNNSPVKLSHQSSVASQASSVVHVSTFPQSSLTSGTESPPKLLNSVNTSSTKVWLLFSVDSVASDHVESVTSLPQSQLALEPLSKLPKVPSLVLSVDYNNSDHKSLMPQNHTGNNSKNNSLVMASTFLVHSLKPSTTFMDQSSVVVK